MKKHVFRQSERVSLWIADGRKCFYEGEPLRYSEIQVDHIVPESTSEAKLAELRGRLLLPDGFEINSIENWATCHQGCNLRKQNTIFEDNVLLFFLGIAKKRASKVQEIMQDFNRVRENDNLLSRLAVRLEKGHLTADEVLRVTVDASAAMPGNSDPWVISYGVNFYDPLPIDAPAKDPELSDWLIERLKTDLASTGAIFHVIDDDRTGETTSVRCAFWMFDFDRVQEEIDECWDLLAAQKYSELFGSSPDKLLGRAVVGRYKAIVEDPRGPVGVSACLGCGSSDMERGIFTTENDTMYMVRCRVCGHSQSFA